MKLFSSITQIKNDLKTSVNYLLKDRTLLIVSFIPVLISILLLAISGKFFYTLGLDYGQIFIKEQLGQDSSKYFTYFFMVLFTIFSFAIINFFFFLIVSILASPFNDIISMT